ncbi:hypothetical protein [Thauera sinica]|uniref:Transmembrane lipoprotein n=1 Tax=Thauera sinica TaxID=2665146 RepID=A0ABW1AQP2_9RHOO|nr:hypothetical protein [Thauera sp. K11]ATE59665.1 hypothetical protein CCZ27_06625 [Thauera sp. K11]
MNARKPPAIRRDWLSKTTAGTLLGLTLALGCSGLFVVFGPDMAASIEAQLAMWMVPPIWLGVLGGTFFFHSGMRAWLWLGGANLLILAVLAAARAS